MTVEPNTETIADPPEPSTGNQADEKGERTYTQAEVEAKLRGAGKAMKELEAKVAAFQEAEAKAKKQAEELKRKKMEKEGDLAGQLELERAEKAKLLEMLEAKESTLSTFKERETARLERLSESNAKRLKALPKALHDLAKDDDPDQMAARLSRAEQIANQGETVDVRGAGGRGRQTVDPEDALKSSYDVINAAIDKRKRGV